MSKGKRDTYTSEFKFKVAIEAMSGDKQCQCGVRLSVQAEKEGDDNGGLAYGEGGPADGRG